ncbi:MAG TPA: protein kinase, partial [Vicinamibacterales bacterium]|nr:protein kinase [Vicinamibacterales bacterium]
ATLAGAGEPPPGFLETPALELAARDLAEEDPLLASGTQFGPYRIVGLLARGGMGDVYRATDVRLGRDVAIKTIARDAGGADPIRLERFVQEARVTAALDHPNIIRVFDVGIANGRPYLVTELLDGETLRARIRRLPMTPEEARRLAIAVAGGLAAAHGRGLVHRDLKPENIFLTKAGIAKILDFGIAKLAEDSTAATGLSTLTGVVLGTAGYLAPEQVTGGPLDGRTDLFTLGSILFEAVTGQRAFARAHTIDTMHAIVHEQPSDFGPGVPAPFAAIVKRLLAKAPEDRFQSADALLAALEQLADHPLATTRMFTRGLPTITRRQRNMILAAAGVLIVGSLGWYARGLARPDAPPQPLMRATWVVPAGTELSSAPAVAPNGRQFAFTAIDKTTSRLYVRSLDSESATAIAGTEGAKQPFWSPNGEYLGFFANGKMRKVKLAGGAPVDICDAPDARGAAWSPSGTIVFSPILNFSALSKVADTGGEPQPVTKLDLTHEDNAHRWPEFLPDGIHFLYWIRSSDDKRRGVFVGRIDRPAEIPGPMLFASEAEAHFIPTTDRDHGVLVAAAAGHVEARPFDAARQLVMGDPQVLPVEAAANTPYDATMVSVAQNLLVAVRTQILYDIRLGSVDRDGRHPQLGERRLQNFVRLSPQGDRLAHQVIDKVRGNPDIWIESFGRAAPINGSSSPEIDLMPVWSPDGRQIAYTSGRAGSWHIVIAPADGGATRVELQCPAPFCEPTDWSRDGQLIVNARQSMVAPNQDVWQVPVDKTRPATKLIASTYRKYDARLSPDGKAVAFIEDRGDGPQVWVQAFVKGDPRAVASVKGGTQPVWRHDEKASEVFYVDLEGYLKARAVSYDASGAPLLGPDTLVNVPRIGAGHWGTQYDITPDGKRIYYLDFGLPEKPKEMAVILGWRQLMKN